MILITGATGHIGNVLARKLLQRGEKVRALVLKGEDLTPLNGLEMECVEGDVLDPPSLERAFAGVRQVYHLAGVISIMPGKSDWVRRVNVEGTLNVLQAARGAGVRRLVYTSSIHAIARLPHGATIDETIPFDPESCAGEYDRSKAQASLAVLAAVRQGLDAVLVCPTGVIGPYDFRGSEMGQLILDCMKPAPMLCVEGAYDFVDVRDVADGLIAACERGRTGETYILSGEQIRISRLMELVQELNGVRARVLKVPLRLARIFAFFTPLYYRLMRIRPTFTPYSLKTITGNSVISHLKARHELAYAPRRLAESLVDTVRWFRRDALPHSQTPNI